MLYQGGTMLLAGPSKARKSYTLIDAAISIAQGAPWLGLDTERQPVLYLNFELQEFAIQSRIKEISLAKDLLPPEHLHVLNLRNWVTGVDDLERELPVLIKSFGIGAVFIDPHYKISAVSGAEENSNDAQAALLSRLEALCGTAKAALIIAHHFSKGSAAGKSQIDRASGGGVFARWPDVFLTLTDHATDDAMTFEFALRNFARMEPFVAEWHHPLWRRAEGLSPLKLKRHGKTEQFPASELLAKLGPDGMRYGDWRKSSDMSDTTFRRKLNELLDKGSIEKSGDLYLRKPVVFAAVGLNSQNRHNSRFNRHSSTPAHDTPTATTFRGGGGGSGEEGPPHTPATTTPEHPSKTGDSAPVGPQTPLSGHEVTAPRINPPIPTGPDPVGSSETRLEKP